MHTHRHTATRIHTDTHSLCTALHARDERPPEPSVASARVASPYLRPCYALSGTNKGYDDILLPGQSSNGTLNCGKKHG
eukprot:2127203-Rhodomonas_salina.5